MPPVTEPQRTRGSCPGVFTPMATGDGWLLRILLPGGAVTADGLDVVADVAASFGSGAIEITSRANLQVRGLVVADLDRAADVLAAAGLAGRDARADALRAVVASPLAGHDPDGPADGAAVVAGIAQRLAAETTGHVPAKFSIVVDESGSWPLGGIDADLRLTSVDGGRQWSVTARREGSPLGWATDPAAAAVAAARLCADAGRRMDGVIADIGPQAVSRAMPVTPCDAIPDPPRSASVRIGALTHRDPNKATIVSAPFLGRLDADGRGRWPRSPVGSTPTCG